MVGLDMNLRVEIVFGVIGVYDFSWKEGVLIWVV